LKDSPGKKLETPPGMMVHFYNPSYSEGSNQHNPFLSLLASNCSEKGELGWGKGISVGRSDKEDTVG
jgi:hypothetical protein